MHNAEANNGNEISTVRNFKSRVNTEKNNRFMKTHYSPIVALSILLSAYSTTAQSINCDLFTVSSIAPDEFDVNNTLINIQMSGDGSDFANYPLVASVTDCNGDTVATGAMFFFGQIGGTEQSYPVTMFAYP
jgi:hypothetical protein